MVKREPSCRACGIPKITLSSGILRCPECRKRRGREYYHTSERRRDNQRRAYIFRKYGLSLEHLTAILAAQHERCAICKRHWTDCTAGKRSRHDVMFLQHLYVDHDHSTGKVRGLLCNNCNAGIALFAEEPVRLYNAVAYLRMHAVR